ncbi:MAG TPA: hypothetical protein PK987_03415 [Ferruginibacter sp.]|nr:hypothetical protein [Ferruginibacter sp.]
MRNLITILVILCSPVTVFCQDISGLWTGTLKNDSTRETLKYEIFINKTKGKYAGYSQTWFLVNDKQYYSIKKIQIRTAKDGKIVIQDGSMVENNYPNKVAKNVMQLNVLKLVTLQDEMLLDGIFVTNSSKAYAGLTGIVNIKKTSSYQESSLMKYINKAKSENDVTVLK